MPEQEPFSGNHFKEVALQRSYKRMDRAGEALDRILNIKPQDQTLLISSLRELYVRAAISVSIISRDIFIHPPSGEPRKN